MGIWKERKKERKWTSVSATASFFALILSPQAARCSQARCYMATIRRAESQHLVLPNLWQLTVHTHAYTQPGGTSSITLAGHSRVNKDCSPLPDLPAAQPFHPRADTMYSLQAQKQRCLNPFKGLDPCTEGWAECLRGLCDFFRSIYAKCTVSQWALYRNNKT